MRTHGHEIETFPEHARSVIFEANEDGSPLRLDVFVDEQLIGRQYQNEDGALESLHHIRDNELHGPWYEFRKGALSFITRYVDGLEHGIATQYLPDGQILGRYEMDRGTGVDLWYSYTTGELVEEREVRDGARHGVERWWNDDGSGTVWQERCFWEGHRHGIFRRWDDDGLLEAFPRFFVDGREVSRLEYAEAAGDDQHLPEYSEHEDAPRRTLLSRSTDMIRALEQ